MVTAMSQIEATPLSPLLGARITGCSLKNGITGAEAETLRRLLRTHYLLVFHEPDLDAEAHVRFVGLFGTVRGSLNDGRPYSMVTAGVDEGIGYHADFSFTRVPLPVVSLWGDEVAGDGVAATGFINVVRLCAALPASLRERVAGRTVFHASDIVDVGQRSVQRLSRADVDRRAVACCGTSHPAILAHPGSGEEILFVNEYLSVAIDGMAPAESDRLLEDIFAYLYTPQNIYTHRWQPGDLIIFDNLALQHCRTAGARRLLRRVIVSEPPLADIMPSRLMHA